MKRTTMFTGILAGMLLIMSFFNASTVYAQSAKAAKSVSQPTSAATTKPADGWLMTKEGIGPVKIGMQIDKLPKRVDGLYTAIVPITDELVNLKQGNESLQLNVKDGLIRGIIVYSKLVKLKVGNKLFGMNGNFDILRKQPGVTFSVSGERAEYKGVTAEDYEGYISAFYIGQTYD